MVVYAPQGWRYNSAADMATATFTAMTDTGYTSAITVNLDQTGPTGTIPFNSTPYPFEVASSSAGAWEAWLSTVASKTYASAQLSFSTNVPLSVPWVAGQYTVSVSNIDSNGDVDASYSATDIVPPPPSGGCGTGNPKCYQP